METTLPPLPDLAAVDAADLIASGSLDLGNGYRLKLETVPDEDFNPFDECDIYGKIEHCDRWNRSQRPAGFDGSAEKLRTQHATYWWQPYREGRKIYRDCRRAVVDLLEYGPIGFTLALRGPSVSVMGTESREIATASIWGFEPFCDPDPETIKDLISELQS